MARAGMSQLITDLRRETNAGTADFTIVGVTYWTDDQLQSHLDRTRNDFFQADLRTKGEVSTGGTIVYTKYMLPDQARWVERAGSESHWRVYDVEGTEPGTATYTVHYDAGYIEFDSDTENTTYYLDFSAYDLYWAASNVWEAKATYVANTSIDWSSDNHRVSRKQLRENYMDMARTYRLKSPRSVRNVRRYRADEVRGS